MISVCLKGVLSTWILCVAAAIVGYKGGDDICFDWCHEIETEDKVLPNI